MKAAVKPRIAKRERTGRIRAMVDVVVDIDVTADCFVHSLPVS